MQMRWQKMPDGPQLILQYHTLLSKLIWPRNERLNDQSWFISKGMDFLGSTKIGSRQIQLREPRSCCRLPYRIATTMRLISPRPCQYVIEAGYGANCQSALWTDARFNQVVIADMSKALDQILLERAQTRVILVGGSGGATVAMLLAAQRKDIAGVVTLSGLLNHRAWTKCHKISESCSIFGSY